MKFPNSLPSSFNKFLFIIPIIAIVAVIGCDSEEATPTQSPEVSVNTADFECADLEETPETTSDVPLGPPPALPNIFIGTAYVDGQPAPTGEKLYVKLVTSRSYAVEITEGGEFRNIIHGPVSDADQDVEFQFCLGDPEGTAVKSTETFEFDGSEPFKETVVELNFPMLPSELEAQ